MKLFLKRFSCFFLILGILFLILFSQTGRNIFLWTIKPVLWVSSKISYQSVKKSFKSKHSLMVENKNLKEKLDIYYQRILNLEEIQKENERLRSLIGFEKIDSFNSIVAQVISRDPMHWFEGILINKGRIDGVRESMPVVIHKGLVGSICEVYESYSKVRLIVDRQSRVGSMLQDCREVGVLKGKGRKGCRIEYLSRHVDIKKGEPVLTSGFGSFFPKGLLIGKVSDVFLEKGGLFQIASVDPVVNFGHLEELLVLKINNNKEKQEEKDPQSGK